MSIAVRITVSALFAILTISALKAQSQGSEQIQALYTPISVPSAVAYSPDSTHFAVGSGNGQGAVQVVSIGSGATLSLSTAATNGVSAVSFSPDGSELLVGGSLLDGSGNSVGVLEIWNSQTGTMISRLTTGATGGVNSAAFSPDGQFVAAGGTTSLGLGELEIWKFGAKSPALLATASAASVNSVAFAADSSEIIAGGTAKDSTGVVEIWSTSSKLRLGTIPNYCSAGVFAVAVSPDGTLAAIGGQTANGSAVVEVRSVSTGASVSVLPTYLANTVTSVAFNPSGTLLADGGISNTGGTIELWNVSGWMAFGSLPSLAGPAIHSLCFSADGRTLLDGGEAQNSSSVLYGLVERWTVSNQSQLQAISSDDSYGAATAVALSKDGKTVAAGGSGNLGGLLELWNTLTGVVTLLPTAASYTVNTVAYSPDGSLLADAGVSQDLTGTYGSVVELWNTSKNTLSKSLSSGADLGVNSIAFSPDGRTLAVGGTSSSGGLLEIWSVSTGTLLASLTTSSTGGVFAVAFSPDGTQLAAGGWTGSAGVVEVWNVATKKLAQNIATTAVQVSTLAYSPDGKNLAVGGAGQLAGTCEVWLASTGKLLENLPLAANTYSVVGLAFTASGRVLLVSTGANLQAFAISSASLLETFTNNQLSMFVPPVGNTLVFGTAVGGLVLADNPLAGFVPVSSISVSPKSVIGGSSVVATVTLAQSAPVGGSVVNLSASNASALVPATVTVPAGSTSATFSVQTSGVDSNTVATISAGDGSNTVSASLNVGPASPQSAAATPTSVVGGGTFKLTVTLTGLAGPSGISLALASSDAVISAPSTVLIGGAKSSATLVLTAGAVSASKVVKLTVGQGALSKVVAVTVLPATVDSVTVDPASVLGGTNTTGTVTLTGLAGHSGESVIILSNSAAVIVPHTVVIPAGASQATFNIITKAVPSNKVVQVKAITGATVKTADLIVTPPDLATLSISPSSLLGGSSAMGTLSISSPAPVGGLAIKVVSNSLSATVPATAIIPSGKTTGTFAIHVLAVGKVTTVTITSTLNGVSKSSVLTINPPVLKSLAVNPATVKGGLSATGTVTLGSIAPVGGFKVVLSSSSSTVLVPASAMIPAGRTSVAFTVKTSKVTASKTVTVSGSANGTTVSGSVTVH